MAATWNPNLRLIPRGELPPITPRDHQIEAWDCLTKHYLDLGKQAGLVVVPTGGGKTILAAHWLLQNHVRRGGRVLWLAHRRSLLRQAFQTFRWLGNAAFPCPQLDLVAISSEDARWSMVSPEHNVVFSSMQTAVLENNRDFVETFVDDSTAGVFVVVDEAHHAPAPSYARLLRRLKERTCKLLGLTATPVRTDAEDQRRLAALFEEAIVYQISRRELTTRRILAEPSFETVKTRVEVEKEFTPDDFKHLERYGEIGPAVLQRLARNAPRNKLIVEQYVRNKDRYGPTIVFAADTSHCITLADEFQKAGVTAGFTADYVAYTRGDSQAVINRFQEKREPDVLINVEMLTEGFDAPHTRTVFIARPTRSEGLLSQMVGRALRGPQSNGNDVAYLVTFLDTWQQFNVLDAEYVLGTGEDVTIEPPVVTTLPRISIPIELVREAYQLLVSNIKGYLEGVYQCLPYGWFVWEEMFEDDLQRRTVMVFDNQREGFAALLADHGTSTSIPEDVTEDYAREMVRRYFSDVPDPLPRWADIAALLDAKRKECEIFQYTFEEKKLFDPTNLAKTIVDENMTLQDERRHIEKIWSDLAACRFVYRDDFSAFLEDVSREKIKIISPKPEPLPPEVKKIIPAAAPRDWENNSPGYNLISIRDTVLSVKKHFPNGSPTLGDLRWSSGTSSRLWGFCRYSDRSITINRVLNSPDIPLFVLEFLMYHELLHADMPTAGHNRDFRARERLFQPSAESLQDLEKRGISQRPSENSTWRAWADRFLDTFERHFAFKEPGSVMTL